MKEKGVTPERIKNFMDNEWFYEMEDDQQWEAFKQAVELARKEGEERIREIIDKIEVLKKHDENMSAYSCARIKGILSSYLPEKGDNNGVKTK